MQILIAFWKKDIVNKLIALAALGLGLGVIGVLTLILFLMPQGKTISGAMAVYFPSQTPGISMRMTLVAATATQRSADATASEPPSPTTMQFTPFVPSITPEPSNTPLPVTVPANPATSTPSAPTDSPTPSTPSATPTLIPRMPTATRALPTSAHPTATRQPTSTSLPTATSTPFPPGFTPSPTATGPSGLACLPNNPPQTGKVLSVLDGYTIKVLINGFAYNVRYIGVQLPTNKHFALLASVTNNKLAFAKKVTLIPDAVDKDASGYLLRYVLVEDSMPAYDMLKQGVLSTADIPPGFACAQAFKDAQQAAQSQQAGMWIPTVTPLP